MPTHPKTKAFANNQNLLTGTGLTNTWTGNIGNDRWRSEYSYDANGNIRNLKRYDQSGNLMDNLTYTYEEPSARLNTNRLLHVQDAVSGSTNPTDFEVTAAHNPSNPYYAYDQIGNLVKDSSEAIQKIEWDVYGKLKKVNRNSASGKPDIEFFYNSAGQRIMKIVKPNGGTGAMSTWKYTIWTYDLGGNVIAEYGIDYVTASNKYTINAKSHFLYGAGRLGKDLRDSTDYVPLAFRPTGAYTEVQSCSSCATDAVAGAGSYLYGPTVTHTRQLGYKQFELSNHTGNILMVVSDRKNAVDIGTWVAGSTAYNTASTDRKLDYYVADVVEVTDYYPGGMPMPGRSIVDTKFSSFKWGHNGQFNDDEIYGKGNTQMAEFWEYDARLMRRWNTDPLAHAGQSLYEAFYSNPIIFSDPFGLKPEGGIQSNGPGGRKHKKNPDGSTTVTDGRTSWEYDKEGNNAGGDLGTGPTVTITPQTQEEAKQAEAAANHVSIGRSDYHVRQRNRAWQDLRRNPGDDDAFGRLIKYQANIILGSDDKISHSEHKFVENVAKPTSEFIVDLHPATSVYNVANGYWGNGTDWTGEEMNGGVKAMEAGLVIFTIIPGGRTVVKTVTKTIRTIVKSDKRLLKLAKETFEGNDLLRKEANSLIEELATGNMNPGIGTKNIAKNVFEARSRNGARVYFRNVNDEIEIIGYSNKSNQQQVINRILELYTK